jgi:hypothetical protein
VTIGNRSGSGHRPFALWALLALLALEFLLITGVVVVLVVELLVAPATSLASAIALTVVAAIAAVWVGAILAGAWRGRAWSKSAALVWQVLQFAVGLGALQGALAQPAWGWPLVLASVAGFVLCLSRPVASALTERDPR